MCFDSLNSSDIACGEYASRTLAGKQAPSMAKTTAIDSKQCRRAKPEGSPALLCALGSRFWGESPDGNVISRLSSGYLGRKPGRVSLLHTSWKDYGQKVTEVYRKTCSKHRFWIPLGNKTGKMRSRCIRAGTNQNASRCVNHTMWKSKCFTMCNPSMRKSECFTICYTNKHKSRSFLPSMVLATQIASGGRISQRRRSFEFETHIFTLDSFFTSS